MNILKDCIICLMSDSRCDVLRVKMHMEYERPANWFNEKKGDSGRLT